MYLRQSSSRTFPHCARKPSHSIRWGPFTVELSPYCYLFEKHFAFFTLSRVLLLNRHWKLFRVAARPTPLRLNDMQRLLEETALTVWTVWTRRLPHQPFCKLQLPSSLMGTRAANAPLHRYKYTFPSTTLALLLLQDYYFISTYCRWPLVVRKWLEKKKKEIQRKRI